jgi:hypothetical protein
MKFVFIDLVLFECRSRWVSLLIVSLLHNEAHLVFFLRGSDVIIIIIILSSCNAPPRYRNK